MKKIILLFIINISYSYIYGQQSITGRIIDEQNIALPGVSVIIKNTQRAVVSDMDGNYKITASPQDTLVFSMVGLISQRIYVGTQSVINITLLASVQVLNEVVVIGYGTVRKSDLTGSVSSVKGNDITKITSLNAEQGLQGKVTGVQVSSISGAPGASASIRIRGVGTFNNSSPIFVVDGVILDDISFLNSADIASMEVLKDASATAIYGARGSNGVILVTTKTGKAGEERATFNYSGESGIQKLVKPIDLLNGKEYAIVKNSIIPGSYNNIDLVPSTDWQKLIFHTATIQNHQISASGSTKYTQYYAGLGYFKQNGIVEKSNYERVTFKLNNTYQLTKSFKLGNNISVTSYKQQNAPNVTYAAYRARPDLLPFYPDGSYAVVYNVGNPIAGLENSNDFNKGVRGVGNLFAEAKILGIFTFKSSIGMDAAYSKVENYTPAYTVYLPDETTPSQQQIVHSSLTKQNNDNLTWLWENTLNFNKVLGVHAIDAIVGFTSQESNSEYLSLTGNNIIRNSSDLWYLNRSTYFYDPVNEVNTLGNFNNANGVDPNLNYSMLSFLSRVNYSYDNKYILTGTFRRDGSSKFSQANRYGNFPSFAAGWNVSKEDFMKKIPQISNLKIRGSWGIIGNEKIPYDKQYSKTENLVTIFGNTPSANSAVSYALSGNPNLKWESTTQTDLGLELGLFKNKLTGEFDYYHRVTSDILVNLSTPDHLGNGPGAKVYFNAASVLNSGYEMKIDWKDNIGDFTYNVALLGTFVHDEVLKIGGSSGIDSVLLGGALANGLQVTQSRVGLPIGAFYGYKTDGVFQSQADLNSYLHLTDAVPGDLRFVDVNNDGVINGNDRTYIGSPIPTFIFGFNIGCQYKGFDFSLDIQGQTGNKIYNAKEMVRPDEYNFEKHVVNSWTGAGTSNSEPRASFGGNNYLPSDKFIQDGSFIRLRNLNVGYSLPYSITKKLSIQQLRLYVKGNNLYTITKFTGYTPEIGSSDVLSNGIDYGSYPISAIYSIGINLTF